MAEKERVDSYLDTIGRLEPDITMIDASAFYASAAISLKRIADYLQPETVRVSIEENSITIVPPPHGFSVQYTRAIELLTKLRDNEGECLGDHPDWLREIDAILKGV
jgi:hypothetical protein